MSLDASRVTDDMRRQLGMVDAKWSRAMEAATTVESPLQATRYDGDGHPSGEVSRPTEAAALRRDRNRARRDLERALLDASRAVQRLALLVTQHAPPRARNVEGGAVVIECGNGFGCPDAGRARREGRCSPCWDYLDRHGRDRTAADVADANDRAREAAAARKRAQRSRAAE